MTPWPARQMFDVLVLGKRLGLLLVVVTVYCLAVGLIVESYQLPVIRRGGAAGLVNTIILGLLMSFRNQVAYARWWEARGLWGELTNNCRNVAAKFAAFVPADVLARSRVGELLVTFAVALNCQLRDGSLRLRDLPGFERDETDPPHVPLEIARRLFAALADWKRAGNGCVGALGVRHSPAEVT